MGSLGSPHSSRGILTVDFYSLHVGVGTAHSSSLCLLSVSVWLQSLSCGTSLQLDFNHLNDVGFII